MVHTVEIDLGGRMLTLETGKMAKQANGAVVVRSGDSVVLVTACMAEEPKPEPDSSRSPWITASTLIPPERFRADSSNARDVPRKKKFSPAA